MKYRQGDHRGTSNSFILPSQVLSVLEHIQNTLWLLPLHLNVHYIRIYDLVGLSAFAIP